MFLAKVTNKPVLTMCFLTIFFVPGSARAGWINEMRKEQAATINGTDMEDVFSVRLKAALTGKTGVAIEDLKGFSKEYPESKFAADARLIADLMILNDVIKSRDPLRLQGYMRDLYAFISKNAEYQVRGVTYRKITEIVGAEAAPRYNAVRIPFKHIMFYVNGKVLQGLKNWEGVIDNFLRLKNDLGESRECEGVFEYEIYPELANAYVMLGQLPRARAIAVEGLKRFPENQWFQKFITRLDRNELKSD